MRRIGIALLIIALLLSTLPILVSAHPSNNIIDSEITPSDGIVALELETTVPMSTPTATTEAVEYSTLMLGDSGTDVLHAQARLTDLGYYSYKVTGYYGELTVYAVKLFQLYNDITVTGTIGPKTNEKLYANEAVRLPMDAILDSADRLGQTPTPKPTPTPTPTPKPTKKPTKKPTNKPTAKPTQKSNSNSSDYSPGKGVTGEYLDWFKTVNAMFPKGMVVTVTDFYTGISWKVKRTGGYNHADVEPISKEDTTNYKKAYNGRWSWDRRPVTVNINGRIVAASVHGQPHGYDRISGNGIEGHYCIHFLNSRTHGTNSVDKLHQSCVKIAAGLSK